MHPLISVAHGPLPKNMQRRFLLTALASVSCGAAALAQNIRLPPIVDPATTVHHEGKVIFVELVTPDLAGSKRFYGGLFGWDFRDIQVGGANYTQVSRNGRAVAGMIQRDRPASASVRPSWLGYFAVRDVDAAKTTALVNRGRILFEPQDFPGRGREAVFADPQGAVFAVLASSSGDPQDVRPAPGEWIWSALLTTDPVADAAFYKSLFGETLSDLPASQGHRHILMATEGYARGSINSLPVARPDAHPHWLNFVRVEDTVAAVKKVTALGGHVEVEPRPDRHGGKIAILTDPLGAPFGLMEWPATQSMKVSP